MFALFRPKIERRSVDGGHVYCRLRDRDVEVDLCAGCDSLVDLDLDASPPFIRCIPGSALSPYERA